MFANWFDEEITLEPLSVVSTDGWRGEPSYGAVESYRARIEWVQMRVTNPEGIEQLSRGRLFIEGQLRHVQVTHRLTLPESCSPRQPRILQVEVNPDPLGIVEHTVIWF